VSDTTSGLDQPTGSATGLQRLARASWRSMLQVALLVLVLSVLVRTIAGLDIDEITSELTDAWPLVGLAFITAQAPRLTQSL